MFLKKSDLI